MVTILRRAENGKIIEIKCARVESKKLEQDSWTVIVGAFYSMTGPNMAKMCDDAEKAYNRRARMESSCNPAAPVG